jgi:hypothetical protein
MPTLQVIHFCCLLYLLLISNSTWWACCPLSCPRNNASDSWRHGHWLLPRKSQSRSKAQQIVPPVASATCFCLSICCRGASLVSTAVRSRSIHLTLCLRMMTPSHPILFSLPEKFSRHFRTLSGTCSFCAFLLDCTKKNTIFLLAIHWHCSLLEKNQPLANCAPLLCSAHDLNRHNLEQPLDRAWTVSAPVRGRGRERDRLDVSVVFVSWPLHSHWQPADCKQYQIFELWMLNIFFN